MSSVLENYPDYEVNIGMEVHAQLSTKTKIFCTCANVIVQEPNLNICQICTGQPGVLPVLNEEVVHYAIKAGLATHSQIAYISKFDRKHYFYPDLPKNYQITQNDQPICANGYVQIRLEDGTTKKINLIRIHIEEDAGKNIHSTTSNESFVDLNRAGTPLLEIVSTPTISSSYETRQYLKELRLIVQYLGICSGNMEEGAFRADTNISVRKKGETKLGTKCELKNINSFKFISDAIEYEIERQINLLESGQRVMQETRLWDTHERKTVLMRSKEEAADYRYFADPDLPCLKIERERIESVHANLPELPAEKFDKFVKQKGLTPYEAEILVNDIDLAQFYEKASQLTQSKQLINWILRDFMALLKDKKIAISQSKITPEKLGQLIDLLDKSVINNRAAQEVFAIMADTGQDPKIIVKERGLEQIGSSEELEKIIKEIVDQNPAQVSEYKSGREKVFGFFVGQAMQKTKGKGDPKLINDLLRKYLS